MKNLKIVVVDGESVDIAARGHVPDSRAFDDSERRLGPCRADLVGSAVALDMKAPEIMPSFRAMHQYEDKGPAPSLPTRNDAEADEKRIDMAVRVIFGMILAVLAIVCVLLYSHGSPVATSDKQSDQEYAGQMP